MEPKSHKGSYIALVLVNFFVLLCVYFFNTANTLIDGLFKNTVGDQSDKYYLEITPAGWTFSIWGFIYVWQALWCLYSLILLCRRTDSGPAYLCPVVLSPALLFLFDRDVIEGAFVSLLLIAVFLIVTMAVSYRTLDAASPALLDQKRTVDIWFMRVLVHNGLGIYATWTSIASLLNMAMVIRYRSDPVISNTDACSVALGVLTAEILVFVATDLILLDRYSRYTITPYIVVVVALVGSMAKNWDAGARNSIFTAVLLGIGSAGLVLKLVMMIYRHVTRSKYTAHHAVTLDGYKGGQLA
ncbi:hypothetical protein BaRGS_00029918 [Batillaria attramentaria]|uniref:Uncharacterized protein n=1 Tax=Batillaria attramentaria TaxID=370345 RepID=A0ABD0JUR4_9CAEN